MKKLLVIGIIALFIGLAFIPSFNAVSNSLSDNFIPKMPNNPLPEDGETDVPINNISLDWDGDVHRNDVYFGKSSPPPLVAENLSATWYEPGLMDANTIYYWQIVAKDYAGGITYGPIWNFTTGSKSNHQPNAPELSADKLGGGMFLIKIKLTDPDGDDLDSYAVRWDTIQFVFIYDGPFENGTIIEEFMGYSRGWHELKAECADRWNIVSDWDYLELEVSKSQVQNTQKSTNYLFLRFLERCLLLNRLINIFVK